MQDLPNGGGAHPEPQRPNSGGGGGADPSIGPRALETLGTPLPLYQGFIGLIDMPIIPPMAICICMAALH